MSQASPATPTEPPANESCFSFLKGTNSVTLYAAQCVECYKWRLIDNEEEYEKTRSKLLDEPFICSKKPNICCEDVADIEKDGSRTWVIDKPNIPQTPPGFKRKLVFTSDLSELEAHYVTPIGTKLSSSLDVDKYLKENPDIEGVSVADFSFTVPEVAEDTLTMDAPETMISP
ncbi:methyl-CpG-binding domain-containing protein 4-like [Silene latifolia]|uniref:methyl-CpG-binding domain-containing protein 4-like n=1 Tax=Silene latifolia TaxID=37657 RepID=UPI003D7738CF